MLKCRTYDMFSTMNLWIYLNNNDADNKIKSDNHNSPIFFFSTELIINKQKILKI